MTSTSTDSEAVKAPEASAEEAREARLQAIAERIVADAARDPESYAESSIVPAGGE